MVSFQNASLRDLVACNIILKTKGLWESLVATVPEAFHKSRIT